MWPACVNAKEREMVGQWREKGKKKRNNRSKKNEEGPLILIPGITGYGTVT